MDDLIALAERCEAATGADREIDLAIYNTGPKQYHWAEFGGAFGKLEDDRLQVAVLSLSPEMEQFREQLMDRADFLVRVPAYTASLDAATSLVPEGMVVLITNTGISGRGADLSLATAHVGFPDMPETDASEARSMALALTAASLRARAAALKLEG